MSNLLHGGNHELSHTGEKDVNPKELKKGLKVEREHTPDIRIRKEIALDHLSEIPDYYTRLNKMEEEAKKDGKFRKISMADIKKVFKPAAGLFEHLKKPVSAMPGSALDIYKQKDKFNAAANVLAKNMAKMGMSRAEKIFLKVAEAVGAELSDAEANKLREKGVKVTKATKAESSKHWKARAKDFKKEKEEHEKE